jgi:hypothetical protein
MYRYRMDPAEDKCCVCLDQVLPEKVEHGECIVEIPLGCGHWIHGVCLRGWKKGICPNCRQEMTPAERALYCKPDFKVAKDLLHKLGLMFYLAGGHFMDGMEGRSRGTVLDAIHIVGSSGVLTRLLDVMQDMSMNQIYNEAAILSQSAEISEILNMRDDQLEAL